MEVIKKGILNALERLGLSDEAVDFKRSVKGLLSPDIKGFTEYSNDPLIQSVIIQESGGDSKAVSRVGAQGLMQIMPNTAKQPGFGVKPLKDAFDPQENVRFGTEYLSAMQNRYGNTRDALIAYNWGVGNTDKWLKAGANIDKLPKETRNYFSSVMGRLDNGR
jgi:soluble lytic murein transglycosylase-like protein